MKNRDYMRESCEAIWAIAGVLAIICVMGCSPGQPAALSGKVNFDSKPVEEGNIRLFPMGDAVGQGAAAQITNGNYTITLKDGLFAGQFRVMITAMRPATEKEIVAMKAADDEGGREREEEGEDGAASAKPVERKMQVQYIPARYNQDSQLTLQVTPGENTKDFDLTP